MKSLKYIWRNVTRNKLRSSLTILSVGFSLALMTVLHGYLAMQQTWGNESKKYNRIVVMNIQGFSGQVPIAMVERIRQQPGVQDAVPYRWYGGDYQDEKMPFAQFGTDPEHVFNVWAEYSIDPAQLSAWQKDRQGCVVDRKLAEKRGWQIGDRIPIKGTFFPVDLDLKLVGVFDSPIYTDSLLFDWEYLNEALKQKSARGADNCGTIFAKAKTAAVIPDVIQTIDSQSASSQYPTRTQTEAAFAQMFSDMMGGVQFYIALIGFIVAFSLCLVAANSMSMSMRERTTEIAVLKAIGFSRTRILEMVLGEACMIALLGGLIGVGFGCLFLHALHVLNSQMFQFGIQDFAGLWLLPMLGMAAGIGIVSGIVPAVRAAQLTVIDGLRRVV